MANRNVYKYASDWLTIKIRPTIIFEAEDYNISHKTKNNI